MSTRGEQPHGISVLVMGEVVLHREGIARLLAESPRIRVIGTASAGPEGHRLVRELRPEVAIVDLPIEELCALALTMREAVPGRSLVALVACPAEGDVVMRAVAGIGGYATRETSVDQLVRVVEQAAGGPTPAPPPDTAWAVLTSREREILALAGEGLTNKEIARRLQIELPTVKSHMHNILEKLHVRSRTEAAALALWPRERDLAPTAEPSPGSPGRHRQTSGSRAS